MDTWKTILFITGCCLALIAASCTTSANGKDKVMSDKCEKSWQITRGTSPWQGLTSSSGDEEASKKIRAVPLKDSDYKTVPGLEKYSVNGVIIIGRSEKLRRVAVEVSLFSDLSRADATRPVQGRFKIGTYRDLPFAVLKPRQIAEFLIESQIINTFWHVEADLCLVAEEDSADSYRAHFKGKHIYFTNERNEEPLDFTIIIDKKTGEMFLETD